MKPKYIFFDFDGTISDARRLTHETLLEILDKMDFEFSKLKLKKLMGSRIQNILKELGISESFISSIRKKFYNNLSKKVNKKILKLCSDIKPLYKLQKKGYEFIVISNAESSFIYASIKALKIDSLFSEVYGGEKFLTKDKILKKLIKKYKIKPKQTYYIGDRFSDIDYAHRAHINAIAIHNECSWSTKKEILSEKPDYIINNFKDLLELIEKINIKS